MLDSIYYMNGIGTPIKITQVSSDSFTFMTGDGLTFKQTMDLYV